MWNIFVFLVVFVVKETAFLFVPVQGHSSTTAAGWRAVFKGGRRRGAIGGRGYRGRGCGSADRLCEGARGQKETRVWCDLGPVDRRLWIIRCSGPEVVSVVKWIVGIFVAAELRLGIHDRNGHNN